MLHIKILVKTAIMIASVFLQTNAQAAQSSTDACQPALDAIHALRINSCEDATRFAEGPYCRIRDIFLEQDLPCRALDRLITDLRFQLELCRANYPNGSAICDQLEKSIELMNELRDACAGESWFCSFRAQSAAKQRILNFCADPANASTCALCKGDDTVPSIQGGCDGRRNVVCNKFLSIFTSSCRTLENQCLSATPMPAFCCELAERAQKDSRLPQLCIANFPSDATETYNRCLLTTLQVLGRCSSPSPVQP